MVTYGAQGADASARKALGSAADYIFASSRFDHLAAIKQVVERATS
jgi:hypothetical protein